MSIHHYLMIGCSVPEKPKVLAGHL